MTDKPKKTRAPGGGRKPLPSGEKSVGHTIRVTEAEWAFCKAHGSAGDFIRSLIAKAQAEAEQMVDRPPRQGV